MREGSGHATLKALIACGLIGYLAFATIGSHGQSKKHWQAGTILDVKTHEGAPVNQDAAKTYDISIKVGKRIYVVLYESEKDQADPGFYVGVTRTVLVSGDTLKINNLQGNTRSLRVLSSRDAPPADSQ